MEKKIVSALMAITVIASVSMFTGCNEKPETSVGASGKNLTDDVYVNPYLPENISEEQYLCNPKSDLEITNDDFSQTQKVTNDFIDKYGYYYFTVAKK